MGRYAVIGDPQASAENLENVLASIERRGIPRENIVCVGDIVGYGPDPRRCLELLEGVPSVMGNHEKMTINVEGNLGGTVPVSPLIYSSKRAFYGVHWTWRDLYGIDVPLPEDGEDKLVRTLDQTVELLNEVGGVQKEMGDKWVAYMKGLPFMRIIQSGNSVGYVCHANPLDVERNERESFTYILEEGMAKFFGASNYHSLEHVFKAFDWTKADVVFTGHSHCPGAWIHPDVPGRMLVNAGSVGLPRDERYPYATYVVWDTDVPLSVARNGEETRELAKEAIELVCVDFRYEKTSEGLRKYNLPDRLPKEVKAAMEVQHA